MNDEASLPSFFHSMLHESENPVSRNRKQTGPIGSPLYILSVFVGYCSCSTVLFHKVGVEPDAKSDQQERDDPVFHVVLARGRTVDRWSQTCKG